MQKEQTFNYLNKTEQYQQATCFVGQYANPTSHFSQTFGDPLQWHSFLTEAYWQGLHIMCPTSWHDPTSEMEILPDVLKKIFIGAVHPKLELEYACAVGSGGSTQKLQKLCTSFSRQNGTASEPLQKRFDYHTLVMFYKIHSHNAPPYLTSLLSPLSLSSGYTFRTMSYRFPAVKGTSTMDSFLPRAVVLWNELSMDIQQSSSTFIFKKRLRTHLKL